MAKFKKIIVIFLCTLLLIPAFSVSADQTNVPSMQSVYGIWNKFSITFTDTLGSNQESIINWADSSNTPTNITVGFNFDMLPVSLMKYSIISILTMVNDITGSVAIEVLR